HRHRGLWKAIGQQLHVFERWREQPNVTLAFAALRGTTLDANADFGRAVLDGARRHTQGFAIAGSNVRFRSWGSHVEQALVRRDVPAALPWLRQRPGELMRRLDHVTRVALAHVDRTSLMVQLDDVLQASVSRVAPGLLLMVSAHLRRRHALFGRRVFFPKG